MKLIQLISAFLFSATIWADGGRVFYTKINGKFEMLGLSKGEFSTLSKDDTLSVPVFDLKDGIASTVKGNDTKYFGMINKNLAVGSIDKVTPFALRLDGTSKVLNLHSSQCLSSQSEIRVNLVETDKNEKAFKCYPTDIYLMTPAEAIKQSTVSDSLENLSEGDGRMDFSMKSDSRVFVAKRHVRISTSTEILRQPVSSADTSVYSSHMFLLDDQGFAVPINRFW